MQITARNYFIHFLNGVLLHSITQADTDTFQDISIDIYSRSPADGLHTIENKHLYKYELVLHINTQFRYSSRYI